MAYVDFSKSKYVLSIPSYSLRPKDHKGEVVILGRSNVGKSSLINRLLNQKIAFSSKKAGKTKLLSYFLVNDLFYIVDSPGYGYTSYGSKEDVSFSEMMELYFENPLLKGALLLIDGRRGIQEDEKELGKYLLSLSIPLIIIFTKSDKLNQSDIARLKKEELSVFGVSKVYLSSPSSSLEELRREILSLL